MIGRTNRHLALTTVALVSALFIFVSPAHAYERVKPASVPSLAGKKLWVEVSCSARQKDPYKEVRLFTGQEVTCKGRLRDQIDAWCVVQTAAGETVEVMVENLSAAKPAYSLLAPGKVEALIPQVAAEAYELPFKLVELWKSHDYCLDKDDDARDARNCYEQAYNHHLNLLRSLVGSSNTSKTTILGDKSYAWLWTADASVMEAYVEGVTRIEAHKKSGFAAKAERIEQAVHDAGAASEAASDIMMVKDELRRKSWLEDIAKDVPKAQRDALDKEETATREKRVAELEKRVADDRAAAEKARKELGF